MESLSVGKTCRAPFRAEAGGKTWRLVDGGGRNLRQAEMGRWGKWRYSTSTYCISGWGVQRCSERSTTAASARFH